MHIMYFLTIILTIRRSALILCRCVKSEKGEPNMRKNTKYDWIIAVSDSDGVGVELEDR